ncbi:MAG: PrsW family glutamic-type intramembrane protease, partial [Candidatus Portnoybacteria bacterium]|nr:PrsW family glutamic-type intramembrane protease [Candidatus Portnoybacteria bacterium]
MKIENYAPMHYFLYIFLGLLPSLIWLSFYLRKDQRPEPNSVVLKLFFWGILITPFAIVLELLLVWALNPDLEFWSILSQMPQNGFLKIILAATLVPAVVEEYLKYAVVRF